MRGLTRSVIALIVPPLPAPSRPSKRMQTFNPLCTTHAELDELDVQPRQFSLVFLPLQLAVDRKIMGFSSDIGSLINPSYR